MYGSSRLGSIHDWTYVSSLTPHTDTNRFARVLGQKSYELGNHLPRETAQRAPRSGFHWGEGNVLPTISDQKKALQNGSTGSN